MLLQSHHLRLCAIQLDHFPDSHDEFHQSYLRHRWLFHPFVAAQPMALVFCTSNSTVLENRCTGTAIAAEIESAFVFASEFEIVIAFGSVKFELASFAAEPGR